MSMDRMKPGIDSETLVNALRHSTSSPKNLSISDASIDNLSLVTANGKSAAVNQIGG